VFKLIKFRLVYLRCDFSGLTDFDTKNIRLSNAKILAATEQVFQSFIVIRRSGVRKSNYLRMKQNGCWYELYCIGARNRSGRASFDFCGDHAVDRTYLRAWPSDYFPVILERAGLRLYERPMPLLLSASLRRSNVVYSTSPKLFATVHTTDEEVTNQVLSRGTRLAPLLRSYPRRFYNDH